MKKLSARRQPKVISDLRDLVVSGAEQFGDKTLYIYKENKEEKKITFNDNLRRMNALGTAFSKLGIMGKRVAVIGETHPSYMTTFFATVNGNGVIVPIDKDLKDDEIVGFMNLAEVSAVVYTSMFDGRMVKLADKLPNVEYFIPIFGDEENVDGKKVIAFEDLIKMGERELEAGNRSFLDVEIDHDKMCAIIFTSGTTGTSKGVMLSQSNFTYATNSSCLSMQYDDTNVFVDVLPMHHCYEITCGQLAIQNLGATMCINDSLKNVMRNFKTYKPNALMLVPLFVETMYKKIWSEIDKKGMRRKVRAAMKISDAMLKVGIDMRDKLFGEILSAFGGELRSIVCGGAPISPQLIKDFRSFGIFVIEGYGITECSPLLAVNVPGEVKYHSVGRPVYGTEIKIDKANPDDETGEILARGGNVMMGYYKNEEATKAVFTDDGWFRTGDIGYVDRDGFVFITGRKKNVIILSNGKNIFPEELEERISTGCETVSEVLVLGREDDAGEIKITAIVYPNLELLAGKSSDEIYAAVKEDINNLNRGLPVYKQIREVEIRDTEFEKTTSRKIKRYTVK